MITDIRLQHFRSYTDASFEIDPAVNIIVGPNASGKTNLLEAVLMLARGSSYKAKDIDMVQFGADWARLDAHTPNQTRVVKIKVDPLPSKSFEIDSRSYIRLPQNRTMPTVLFEPNDLLLLSGLPEMRRSFLDGIIEQTNAGYGAMYRQYRRVLAQRNALLKKNPPNLTSELFVWNLRLSELGGKIARERHTLVGAFTARANDLYGSISGDDKTIGLEYSSRFNIDRYETELLHKLEASLPIEIMRGFTAYGPHRDDFKAYIDGHNAADVASRGEVRTLVLTFKILELQLLEEARQVQPILLLDDVFSELDTTRRQALTKFVANYQTFITTTDADVVVHHFSGSNIIPLSLKDNA